MYPPHIEGNRRHFVVYHGSRFLLLADRHRNTDTWLCEARNDDNFTATSVMLRDRLRELNVPEREIVRIF